MGCSIIDSNERADIKQGLEMWGWGDREETEKAGKPAGV
jgi:hypothetical protein